MATTKTTKVTGAAKKAANKPVESIQNISNGEYGEIEVVTSAKLKRRFVNDAYSARFFIPAATYTQLNILGLQLGVTWDEVVRGLIDQHLASADQLSGLRNFVPALS